jgi:glycosyltransferase involved in cell wall biosynthesis
MKKHLTNSGAAASATTPLHQIQEVSQRMKVLVAAASFSSQISGIQRHAFNVVRCLLQLQEISAVHLVVAPWQRAMVDDGSLDPDPRLTVHIGEMEPSSLSRNVWYYRELPILAARLRADVVHLTFPMPVDRSSFACPTVVTLHDLYPYESPQNFGFPKCIFNRLVLQQCLRNVDAIACVSEITDVLLRRYAPAAGRKAIRIYNCVDGEPLCAIESPIPGWQDEPFLLCVAQHRHNKNIPLLLRTFDLLLRRREIDRRTKLVVIGIGGPESRRIHRMVSDLGLRGRVHFLKGLSEPELQWCYARCEALVTPSITEGFGLPVVEALLAGCRVVCSDIPAFREVGGNHCRFVALRGDEEKALAEAIVATLQQPAQAPVALPQFSSSLLANQYLGLYHGLIASNALPHKARFSGSLHAAATERQSL